jgi:hypothetical protein
MPGHRAARQRDRAGRGSGALYFFMLVRLEMEGGFALVPGLNRPITLDSEDLGAAGRAKLSRLVEEAGFFALPASLGAELPGAADTRRYTLTVEDGLRRHSVSFRDPVNNTALAALRDFVRAGGS